MHWPAVCENREGGAGSRGRGGGRGGMPPPFKIAVLGAQGVGKTAVVRRFLHDDYSESGTPGHARQVHLSAAVLNGHVHDLQITDYPAIPSFPGSSLQVCGCCSQRRSACTAHAAPVGHSQDAHVLCALYSAINAMQALIMNI